MYKYTYSCIYEPNINVWIQKYKYSYKCFYVLSPKSPLRLVVNKKSSKILSAFWKLSNKPLS